MKVSQLTLIITLITILFFTTSCSKEGKHSSEITVPLNCVYPGDLELDKQTEGALSGYK